MKAAFPSHELDSIARLGWLTASAPITSLDALAKELGLGALNVKRDDLLPALGGGSKVRKLDYLLAAEPYRSARGWHSVGGLGSGHLVALGAAAELLSKEFHAHVFRTPLSAHVLENLAFTATHSRELSDEHSRLGLLFKPVLWRGGALSGLPVVPPGGSNALGTIGMVQAGLELGEDVRAGRLEQPEHLYIPLGSGGAAVGLRIGCALAGLDCTLHAVAIVERPIATRRRLERLTEATLAQLLQLGVVLPATFSLRPLVVVRNQVGLGYARATARGARAGAVFAAHGIVTEPAYTEKALAALLQDASARQGARVLFWNTLRGPLPPQDPNWKERLPRGLRRYVDSPSSTRRRLLVGGVGLAVTALTLTRVKLEPLSGWKGVRLSAGEAHVLHAVAEVVLPSGTDLERVLLGADRYVASLPEELVTEIGLLLYALEQAPLLVGAGFQRFTAASLPLRDATLTRLCGLGGTFIAAYHGVRDLCFIGYYQQREAWAALGYDGPSVGASDPFPSPLLALPGTLPANAERRGPG